ncbi:cell wall protein RBR3-like isoform X2 [Silurus meridionalis]|uniref:cell wall protein RBR3-like isoform X2 n=1 Tax=Silurus meridionalis TaxID=175797 RepID=UPI001EEB7002|nr:cell wall protein RBR3-like isoform X2 [Silurus meridionalis]XP_046699121.1 cell wall protein RBR3-like isoform X2 [Silurus meridionalis]XP_046699122.1 cell wall protein RBR3-like isoform X2 [Silurus meridionalis]
MSDSNTSPSLTLWSVDASSETEDLSTEYDPPSSPRHTSNKSMDRLITFKRMSDSNTTPSFTLRKQLVDDSSDSSDEREDLSTEYDPPSSPRQISTKSISPPFLLKRLLHSKISPRSQRTVTNWSDFLVRTRSSSSYESGKSSSDSGAPSSISFKSDRSMDRPITFKWMSDSNTRPSLTLTKPSVDASSDSSDEREDLSTEYDPPSSPRHTSNKSMDSLITFKRMSDSNTSPSLTLSEPSVDDSSDSSDEREDLSLVQNGILPASLCSNQGKDQICPVLLNMDEEISVVQWIKPNSPAASYISMRSNQSMDPPLKFRQKSDVMGFNEALSPAPTVASLQSDQSMDPPSSFNRMAKGMSSPSMVDSLSPRPTSVKSDQSVVQRKPDRKRACYTMKLMREHLWCSCCKNTLMEPVSIPCGHSFCKHCIKSYWKKPSPAGGYRCPRCRKRFQTRPSLKLNITLANVVQTQQQTCTSPRPLTRSYAGPRDVACDICIGRKIRAVKSCRTCLVSYCETHVRGHYTVEVLRKHTLIEPTNGLEQGVASNTPAEQYVPQDLITQMQQLQNKVKEMEVKLEVLVSSISGVQRPAKRKRTELEDDSVSEVRDCAVPNQ